MLGGCALLARRVGPATPPLSNCRLTDPPIDPPAPRLQISVSISCVGLYLAEVSTDIFMLEGMAGMGMLPKFFHWKNKCGH